MPQTQRRAQARLFGRDNELSQLRAALADASAGSPQVVVVSGESGVGKTSLWLPLLSDSEATVLTGHCPPLEGEAMPFIPVIGALRGLARSMESEESARLLRRWPAEFNGLLPPGVLEGGGAGVGAQRSGDPALSSSGQARLFEGLLSLLDDISQSSPVLWLIEDVHWADRSTRDLIAFLARSLSTERVLLGMTMRTDDVHPHHPLRRWLAELDRLSLVRRIDLQRLTREATQQQVRRLAAQTGIPVDHALVDLVFDRSDGNPLFTEQLLPWTSGPAEPLPETLHDMVSARLGSLPESVRRLLEVAAVLGRDLDADLLADVAGRAELDIESDVEQAISRRFLRAGPGVGYSFVHPLFREILETDMLPARRRRLHMAAAKALTPRATDVDAEFETIGKIAHHWEVAEAPEPAFEATVRAGLAAERMCAVAEADEYFGRAVTLRRSLDIGEPDSATLGEVDLLMHASQAAHLVGDGPRAVELIDRAIALCTDPIRRSEALERKGAYCFNAGLVDLGDEAYRNALDLLPAEPSSARARVLAGLGLLAMAWTRMAEAEDVCREAINVARLVGAREEEGRALNALGVVTAYRGDFEEGIGFSRRAVEIAEELENPDDLTTSYIDLTHLLSLAGRCDEAVAVYRSGYAAMRRVGLVRQDGSFLQANVAESLVKAGRWNEAADLLDQAMAQRPRGLRAFPVLEHSARLCVQRGQLERAEDLVAQSRDLLDEFDAPDSWRRELFEVEAELMLWLGRPEEGLISAEAGLSLVTGGDETRFAGALIVLAARALADLTEVARAQPQAHSLRHLQLNTKELRDRASAMSPNPLAGRAHPLLDGYATELTIIAELARAEAPGASDQAWSDAAEAWTMVGRPFPAAYAWWREAEAHVVSKHSGERPVAAVRRAHILAVQLGAARLTSEVELLAQWGRIDLIGDLPVEEPQPGMVDLGLTRREDEVLQGLVAGQTNREIADSLFISVKTASVHVSNILRKLGVSSREEAARVAHRQNPGRQVPHPREPGSS